MTVTDVGDVAPVFSSASSATFAENATGAVYTAVAVSDVVGASISFSISGGADSAKFSINSSGVVSFVSSPNHESATDVGGNNVYDIVIRATEAGNTHTVTQSVAVTVTDVGDVAPVFTSANSASFAENGNGAVYTAVATPDVTGAVVSYSISGGLDSARFSIDSSSGVVSFVSVPDFEIPADADSNNSYQFVVSATEAGNTFVATRSLTVTVSNVVVEGSDIHQRQQCQLCRKRHRCGLYRSGESDRIGCVGVIQHQRRGRLGQVQHQQQRGGQLCQQPEP